MRPDGVIVKTQEAFLQRETVLVDSAEATKPNDLVRVDLGIDVGVRLDKPIADPLRVDQAVYKVQVEGISAFDVFANGLSQRVLASVKDPGTEGQTLNDWALVTVSRVSPDEPAVPDVTVPGPTPEDTAPNALIQSDHPRVVALAQAVAGVVNDPWRAATLLEDYLFRTLGKVDYSQVFSSAGVVAQQRKGDCSEHAVLLAATCRARGIPARVAIGLVYSAEDQSFLYHMWNEVWIRDRWVPLDATLGRGGVGACHLKLRDSSLARQSPYSLVSPVIYLIDRLKIEVVSVE
jgi:transglutaminase-like putative cysteine protease